MHMDVIDLKDFYGSTLGVVARRLLAYRLRRHWPDVRGMHVLGFGYATPYLGAFNLEAEMTGALMPAEQGVFNWPAGKANKAALVEEIELPLPDASIDRIVAVHALEMASSPEELIREFWRVLKPGGRLLIAVSNRRGLWARAESTPFGHGRPFSRGQLSKLLKNCLFTPAGWSETLFVPPLNWRPLLRSSAAFERTGLMLIPGFSGVVISEAVKDVHGACLIRKEAAKGRLRPAIMPVPASPKILPFK